MSATNEWLPMPRGISLTSHDSFTRDLLRQFDKRRSQILLDNDDCSLSCSSIDDQDRHSNRDSDHHHHSNANSHISATSSIAARSIAARSIAARSIATNSVVTRSNTTRSRRTASDENQGKPANDKCRLAGDLLRKSSLYLRNKFNNTPEHEEQHPASRFHSWNLKKKKRKDVEDVFKDSAIQTQLSKVVINTTINLEQHQHQQQQEPEHIPSITINPIQPPIITQYPPKPLKYSPVEPLPDIRQQDDDDDEDDDNASITYNKKRYGPLHRLSLPLLKWTAQQQQQQPAIQRRRSDSDLLEKTPTASVFHSISKQWQKLLYNCSSSKKKHRQQQQHI